MSEVLKYDIRDGWMVEDDNGDYVLHSDYEALERENADLTARIASLEREKEEARDKALKDAVFRMCTVYANFDVLTLTDGHKVTRQLIEAVDAMKGAKP